MTNKLIDNRRRNHAEKILHNASERSAAKDASSRVVIDVKKSGSLESDLKKQYEIIKKDLIKLRNDLTKGFDMAKSCAEKKGTIKNFFRSRA